MILTYIMVLNLQMNLISSKTKEPSGSFFYLKKQADFIDYIRIVRVSPFFNFIWGNELACLFLAPKHFGAFFVILTMKGKIRQT